MGPEARRPVGERLEARASDASDEERAASLTEVKRAVSAAETLAREYEAHRRSQRDAVGKLREMFPWLADAAGGREDLAAELGAFGCYLISM